MARLKRKPIRKVTPAPAVAPVRRSFRGKARVRTIAFKRTGNTHPLMPLVSIDKRAASYDPFDDLYSARQGEFSILEPDLPYGLLLKAGKGNSALNQCVEAYVINIEGYGYQLEYIGPTGKENRPAIQAEKFLALDFLDNCTNDRTLRDIRQDSRKDKEYLGVRYFEITRDIAGRPTSIDHVRAETIRKTKKDREVTTYEVLVRGADGRLMKKERRKRFCRYVQIGANGARLYFKEFNDPRRINPKTGNVDRDISVEEAATEIYAEEIYSPGSRYGQPRWIGALPDMLSLRESEMVNLNFFRENAIPAMAILISGGALTEESYDRVVNVINAARGQDAMNRIMVLEAAADENVGNVDQAPPAPRIELKPMVNDRQQDGLFKEHQQSAKRKIRSTMRLPAIYTGDTEEYTKATAQAGKQIAESQVFAPERSQFDDFINLKILPSLGILNWKFRSLGPTVYDPDTLSVMLDRFGRGGAMTPNTLIKIANQILDVQIQPVAEKWGDVPFAYTLGLVGQGMQIEGFEDIFAQINDAANPAVTGDDVRTPANDNSVAARKAALMIKNQLLEATDEAIRRINEATEEAEERLAA